MRMVGSGCFRGALRPKGYFLRGWAQMGADWDGALAHFG